MIKTRLAPVALDSLTWIPTQCTECQYGYYWLIGNDADVRTWQCSKAKCSHRVTKADFSTGDTGDMYLNRSGMLRRGVHPGVTFTMTRTRSGTTDTMTLAELRRDLSEYCQWSYQEVDRVTIEATRDGRVEHTSGYGLHRVITRNA